MKEYFLRVIGRISKTLSKEKGEKIVTGTFVVIVVSLVVMFVFGTDNKRLWLALIIMCIGVIGFVCSLLAAKEYTHDKTKLITHLGSLGIIVAGFILFMI